MRSGFRIGRIFGIDIFIDWSWLFIFFLISWILASTFGHYHGNWSAGLAWGTGLAASALFFVSVLIHELAHSLVAKANRVPVRRITLFLFGGVSNIEKNPPSPRAEFVITIVGPLTSFALGIFFGFLARLSIGSIPSHIQDAGKFLAGLSPVSSLLLWLGPINLLLAIFNLIPGFPLDGGRILRSVLWGMTGDLKKATQWAAMTGQAVAWFFIMLGIGMALGVQVPFFGTGLIGGLWLALIGWFLNTAAVQSYRQVVLKDILEDVPVSNLMSVNPPTVSPDSTVSDLVHEHIMKSDDHAFPVLSNGRLAGLVTLDDVRRVDRSEWDFKTIGDVMTPADRLLTVRPDTGASDALNTLRTRDFRQLPVMQNGDLVGLLRRRDVIRWLQVHEQLHSRR